mmetsp:Transcript_4775/g.10448  ORF Transcript_4775/g.10448 Transcript_4775/m.10448 type:complete len:367 (-) Transcript_4775:276-1376(-)
MSVRALRQFGKGPVVQVGCLLPLSPQHVDDRLEGKPLGDVLAITEHLPELGARELLDVVALLLGVVSCDVVLLARVHEVERWHRLHAELVRLGLGEVLRLEGAVEVLASDRRLGASHVTANDEVCAAEVLADHHVVDRLARASHVHGVRQVGPARLLARLGVLGLLDEHLVRLVAHGAGDVLLLRRAARRVDEHDGVLGDVGRVERAREELVVGAVDGVAALEGDDVGVLRELGARLGRRLAREVAHRHLEALDRAADVVAAALHGHHAHAGVLNGGGAVALEALLGLVRGPLGGDSQEAHVRALVGEKHLGADVDRRVASVHHHREAEDEARWQLHLVDDAAVLLLGEESRERREAAVAEELDIA